MLDMVTGGQLIRGDGFTQRRQAAASFPMVVVVVKRNRAEAFKSLNGIATEEERLHVPQGPGKSLGPLSAEIIPTDKRVGHVPFQ